MWRKMMELQTSTFLENVAGSDKRKGECKDPMPEKKELLEETIAVKDDGHSMVDWALRNK